MKLLENELIDQKKYEFLSSKENLGFSAQKEFFYRWKRISKIENEFGKPIEEFSKDEFLKLFENLNNAAYFGFTTYKKFILDYLKWMNENFEDNELPLKIEDLKSINFEDIEKSEIYRKKYFGSFEELEDEMQKTMDCSEQLDFSIIKALIYLAWFGVSKEDCSKILKEDVSNTNNEIYLRSLSKTVILPPKIMDFFREYKNAEGTEKFVGDRRCFVAYKASKYLLRTCKSETIPNPNIEVFLSEFSQIRPDGKKFTYTKIYWSGEFSRFYENFKNSDSCETRENLEKELLQNLYSSEKNAKQKILEFVYFINFFHPQKVTLKTR